MNVQISVEAFGFLCFFVGMFLGSILGALAAMSAVKKVFS